MQKSTLLMLVLMLVGLLAAADLAPAQWSSFSGNHRLLSYEHFTLKLVPPGPPTMVSQIGRFPPINTVTGTPLAVITTTAHGLNTGDTVIIDDNFLGSGCWTITRLTDTIFLLDGSEGQDIVSAPRGKIYRTVLLTEADAEGSPRRAYCRRCYGKAWTLSIPGSDPVRKVSVAVYANRSRTEFFMGYAFPKGIPSGWRVDSLEQRFRVGFKTTPVLSKERFVVPLVYGPTSYWADRARSPVNGFYPTFLQTQQVSLENTETGQTITMATNDDRGLRKRLGFSTDGTATGLALIATYIPEQGTTDPNPKGWTAPYNIRFGFFGDGIGAAIAWYRNAQLRRWGSFLRQRRLASYFMSPKIRDCKFVIGVGATYSPDVLPHGQCDVSAKYRKDTLDFFSALHGDGMLLYHLGWYPESPYMPGDPILATIHGVYNTVNDPDIFFLNQVLPDQFKMITPGHAALIAEAKARDKNIGSVAQTLPAHLSQSSADAGPEINRLTRDGTPEEIVAFRPAEEKPLRTTCYYLRDTSNLYTSLYVNSVFNGVGFDGAYLDALSPAPTCYGHHEHKHPVRLNDQLVGIDRMLSGIRYSYLRKRQRPPILINETPTDCLRTDGSALDGDASNPDYHNVFAMTYSGAEWPRFGVVFGAQPGYPYGPNGLEYLLQLSNTLAMGARPIVLWPEFRHPAFPGAGFPTSPTGALGDPYFTRFVALLKSYSDNYESFWRDIMFGRYLEPLDPSAIEMGDVIAPPPAPNNYGPDPYTSRWRLPGWKPRPGGKGCVAKRLCAKPYPTVYQGLCEPRGQAGRRCLVLVRWADADLATKLNLPSTHPARRKVQSIKLRLCSHSTKSRPGALIRSFCLKQKCWKVLGRIPENSAKVPLTIPLEGVCTKAVFID